MAPPTRKGNSARLKASEKARIEEEKRSETEAAIALAIEQSDDDFVSKYMRPRYGRFTFTLFSWACFPNNDGKGGMSSPCLQKAHAYLFVFGGPFTEYKEEKLMDEKKNRRRACRELTDFPQPGRRLEAVDAPEDGGRVHTRPRLRGRPGRRRLRGVLRPRRPDERRRLPLVGRGLAPGGQEGGDAVAGAAVPAREEAARGRR